MALIGNRNQTRPLGNKKSNTYLRTHMPYDYDHQVDDIHSTWVNLTLIFMWQGFHSP
jgi:hypothetical protein